MKVRISEDRYQRYGGSMKAYILEEPKARAEGDPAVIDYDSGSGVIAIRLDGGQVVRFFLSSRMAEQLAWDILEKVGTR